jgi:uncharacterized protein YcbK (DUF882 family)
MNMDRRNFIKLGFSAMAALPFVANPAFASLSQPAAKTLSFYHLHTGEKLRATFWEKGRYIPESLASINRLLRDFRTNDIKQIDPQLLEVLHNVQLRAETTTPFHIISAYRSPHTNADLRGKSAKVAKNSMHLQGKAIDIRLPGRSCRQLYDVVRNMKTGGAGYYPDSDFVHVDTGRVRHWS